MPDYSQFFKKPGDEEDMPEQAAPADKPEATAPIAPAPSPMAMAMPMDAQPQAQSIGEKFGLTPEDHSKLEGYAKHLDTYNPREEMRKQFEADKANRQKAMDIMSRPVWEEKTPEEQAFVDKHIDPVSQGIMQGGVIGSVGRVVANPALASKLTGKAVELFPKLKNYFQAGEHIFPAGSAAEAMKIRDALKAAGKLNTPGAEQILKIK